MNTYERPHALPDQTNPPTIDFRNVRNNFETRPVVRSPHCQEYRESEERNKDKMNHERANSGFGFPNIGLQEINDARASLYGSLMDEREIEKKRRYINKTGGYIRLNLDQEDVVDEAVMQNKEQNIGVKINQVLVQPPTRDVKAFIEGTNLLKIVFMVCRGIQGGGIDVMEQPKDDEKPKIEYTFDMQMKSTVTFWASIHLKFFLLVEGILAGFSMMHLFILFREDLKSNFLEDYNEIVYTIDTMFYVFQSFAVIGQLVFTFSYYTKYQNENYYSSPNTGKYQTKYHIFFIISFLYLIPFGLTLVNPKFVAQTSFLNPINVEDDLFDRFRALSIARCFFDIGAWLFVIFTVGLDTSALDVSVNYEPIEREMPMKK